MNMNVVKMVRSIRTPEHPDNYVDGRNSVAALSDDGEFFRVLNPRFLEVIVEDTLAIAVPDSTAHDVDLEVFLGGGRRHSNGFQSLECLEILVRHAQMEATKIYEKLDL